MGELLHISEYMKDIFLGWINPEEFTEPADIELEDISKNKGYIVKTENENEYFLFENRQLNGWDKYLPGHGMLVWHIDYDERLWSLNKSNMEPAHQRIDIIEADNKLNNKTRDGDPFPGVTGNTSFTDDTKPGMLSWGKKRQETPITDIREENGIIYFNVKGGADGSSVTNTEIGETSITVSLIGSELVVTSELEETLPICVYDVFGRIITKDIISQGKKTFEIANKGVYVVCVGENIYKIMR